MYCFNCGKEISDSSKFCPYCGTEQPVTAHTRISENAALQEQVIFQAEANEQPINAEQYIFVGDPVNKAPFDTTAVEAVHRGKWPAASGVMGIIAVVLSVLGIIIPMIAFKHRMSFDFITPVIFIIMAILFIIHTKKIPWLTAIPFFLKVVLGILISFSGWRMTRPIYMGGPQSIISLLQMAIPFLLFVFYILQTIIRPGKPVLKVLYIIFMSIEILLLLFSAFYMIYQAFAMSYGYLMVSSITSSLASIFFYLGYGIAVMSVRK